MAPSKLALAGLLSLFPGVSAVASSEGQAMDRIQVTAGGAEATVFDVSRAVSVIDADEMAQRNPQVLSDALRGQAGVFVQQTTAGQGIPIIRGLKGSEVLHLVDGFRINNAFFRNAPNQYLALIDVHSLESVEVLRGPSSGRHGSDALGGVVQLITARPRIGEDRPVRYRLTSRHGSAERSSVVHATSQFSGERQALRLGATDLRAGDRRTGSGERLPTAWSSRAASLAWLGHLADWTLSLDAQFSEQPSTPRVDELIPGFGQTVPEYAEFAFEPNSRSFTRLRLQWQAATTAFDRAELQLGRQMIRDDRSSRPLDLSRLDLESNRSQLDGLLASFHRQWREHRIAYGLELYRDTLQSGRQRVTDGQATERPPRFPDGSRQHNQALWLASQWQVASALRVDGNARLSRFALELPAQADQAALRIRNQAPAYDIGAVWSLNPQTNWVLGYGQAVRAPNAFDAANLGPRPGNRFNLPNPDLKAERLRAAEIGLRQRFGRLDWELFVWTSTARDRISSLETGEFTDDGALIVRSANIDSARLRGAEAMAEYRPLDNWRLRAVVNHTRGKLRTPQGAEPADRIPPLNGELSLRWQGTERWGAWLSLGAAGRQNRLSSRDRSDPRIDPDGTAGWARWSAGVAWQATTDLGLRLSLDNLGDRAYREHGSGLDAAGRGLWLELDWKI